MSVLLWFARRFGLAFPLLLSWACTTIRLALGSFPADCPVVVPSMTVVTLLAPCLASSFLAITAVASSAPITLLLASPASRWCPWSLLASSSEALRHGVCGQGWISVGWCATITVLSPESGILLAHTLLALGFIHQTIPRKIASSFFRCLILHVPFDIKVICQIVEQIDVALLFLSIWPLTQVHKVLHPCCQCCCTFPLGLFRAA